MGRLVFTSGEILTAANMNELSDQSVMVFADSTARSSAIPSPSEGMVTYREDANRVEVYDGSAFGPIGGILQVVQVTKTDTFSTSSTTFTDVTDLSVSITPSSSSSKIFVLTDVKFSNSPGAAVNAASHLQLVRDSTPISIGDSAGSRTRASAGGVTDTRDTTQQIMYSGTILFVDSPATTSLVTYKIQGRANTGILTVNRAGFDVDATASARTASSIILMEVAG